MLLKLNWGPIDLDVNKILTEDKVAEILNEV